MQTLNHNTFPHVFPHVTLTLLGSFIVTSNANVIGCKNENTFWGISRALWKVSIILFAPLTTDERSSTIVLIGCKALVPKIKASFMPIIASAISSAIMVALDAPSKKAQDMILTRTLLPSRRSVGTMLKSSAAVPNALEIDVPFQYTRSIGSTSSVTFFSSPFNSLPPFCSMLVNLEAFTTSPTYSTRSRILHTKANALAVSLPSPNIPSSDVSGFATDLRAPSTMSAFFLISASELPSL
mmetsp:Transcript_34021/g.74607  ORF Transcript_34021/g.74607 Transcript_34021/m.74607 type:complete len:240 (-) Transcript_34021:659-1378(-)